MFTKQAVEISNIPATSAHICETTGPITRAQAKKMNISIQNSLTVIEQKSSKRKLKSIGSETKKRKLEVVLSSADSNLNNVPLDSSSNLALPSKELTKVHLRYMKSRIRLF